MAVDPDTLTRPVRQLGPGSLSWRYAGDWRVLLVGPWVGLVQLSLPGLGAGVIQHSAFYTEPWDRFLRSVPQIAGVVYDGPGAGTEGRRIRDLHTTIKGVDDQGRRYHALDPNVFFWAHATIAEVIVKMVDVFDLPMSPAEKERYYAESRITWSNYGMSERQELPDRVALDRYFADMYTTALEKTPAVTEFIRMSRSPASMEQPWLPKPVWKMVAGVVTNPMWLAGVGMLDPEVREVLGLSWSRREERQFRLFGGAVRAAWQAVPKQLRYMPRAKAAFRREGWPSAR
jgi:uncharacterized protein (DUF2236 family)